VTTDVPFDNLNAVMHLKDGVLGCNRSRLALRAGTSRRR
jgi:hypothetical protein